MLAQHKTLPAGLAILGQGNYQQCGITMAAAVIASMPPLVLLQHLPAPDRGRHLDHRPGWAVEHMPSEGSNKSRSGMADVIPLLF